MFSNDTIETVWKKATVVDGYNSDLVRKDCVGAWILKNEYGNTNSVFGWEIDHVYPQSLGGGDDNLNLRPMQWENNRSKGDDYPSYNVAVQAKGSTNTKMTVQYTVNKSLQDKLEMIYNN